MPYLLRSAIMIILAGLLLYIVLFIAGCVPALGSQFSITYPNIDLSNVIVSVIALLIGGSITWVFSSIIRTRRDVNANFRKLRGLYRDVHDDDWEKYWNDRI